MITTAHIISGGLIGESIGDPYLAFASGIILHYILDAIPHFDNVLEDGKWTWKQWVFTGSDLILTILLILLLKPEISLSSTFLWGAFGGLLPDIFDNVPFWSKKFRKSYLGSKLFMFHEKIHSTVKPNLIWGIATQLVTLIFVYFLVR